MSNLGPPPVVDADCGPVNAAALRRGHAVRVGVSTAKAVPQLIALVLLFTALWWMVPQLSTTVAYRILTLDERFRETAWGVMAVVGLTAGLAVCFLGAGERLLALIRPAPVVVVDGDGLLVRGHRVPWQEIEAVQVASVPLLNRWAQVRLTAAGCRHWTEHVRSGGFTTVLPHVRSRLAPSRVVRHIDLPGYGAASAKDLATWLDREAAERRPAAPGRRTPPAGPAAAPALEGGG